MTTAFRRAILLFGLTNALLALAVCSQLIFSGSMTAGQKAFAAIALVGYTGVAGLAVSALSSLAARTERAVRVLRIAMPVIFTTLQTLLFLDVQIYLMFRFHFNGLVWQTLTATGGWAALKIPVADVLGLLLLTAAMLAAEYKLLGFYERRLASRIAWLRWQHAIALVAVFGVADRAIYAAADLQRDYRIPRAARVVPGYQKLTVRRPARTYFGWSPGSADSSLEKRKVAGGSGLRYPAAPLTFKDPAKKPNVLWVMLESWRYDAFGEQHSPEVYKISQKSKMFHQHISGGNNTTYGIFNMFYGVYGTHRSAFLSAQKGPVLIDRAKDLGYRFGIYASFPMTWPEFRKYTFIDIADSVKDRWPKSDSAENDPLVIDDFLRFVDEKKEQPFFGMILLDSSHAPYHFPEDFGKFKPYPSDAKYIRYLDVTQQPPELRNRYFNAILWEDHQVGRLWQGLEERGLLEDTVVVITGDHGEEFNEHGFRTHSGGFTPEQIHVPLVLWIPGQEPGDVRRLTGHEDLAATFMEMLGVQNAPTDYTQGTSLLSDNENPYVVTCGWAMCAVRDEKGFVVFGLEGNYAMDFDVLDADYQAVPDPSSVMAERTSEMVGVMRELGSFLN